MYVFRSGLHMMTFVVTFHEKHAKNPSQPALLKPFQDLPSLRALRSEAYDHWLHTDVAHVLCQSVRAWHAGGTPTTPCPRECGTPASRNDESKVPQLHGCGQAQEGRAPAEQWCNSSSEFGTLDDGPPERDLGCVHIVHGFLMFPVRPGRRHAESLSTCWRNSCC